MVVSNSYGDDDGGHVDKIQITFSKPYPGDRLGRHLSQLGLSLVRAWVACYGRSGSLS